MTPCPPAASPGHCRLNLCHVAGSIDLIAPSSPTARALRSLHMQGEQASRIDADWLIKAADVRDCCRRGPRDGEGISFRPSFTLTAGNGKINTAVSKDANKFLHKRDLKRHHRFTQPVLKVAGRNRKKLENRLTSSRVAVLPSKMSVITGLCLKR